MDIYVLRRKYLPAEPEFTKLTILDTQIEMLRASAKLLDRKAQRVKWAMAMLALAVVLIAAGLGLH